MSKDQFIDDVNQNIGIIHSICNTFVQYNSAEQKDLFQDIMYQLWKSYPSFNGDSKFSTWMYRVAFNTAITHSKKSGRTPEKVELNENHHTVPAADSSAGEEEVALLYSAIQTLKYIDKAIILLYLDGNSYQDIADVTGLTKTNISVRLVRIKRALKTKLEKQYKN